MVNKNPLPLKSLTTPIFSLPLKKGKKIGYAEAATQISPEQAQVLQSSNLGPDRQGGYRYACSFKTNVLG